MIATFLMSLLSFTPIQDSSKLPLLNPGLEQRQTEKLQLENGLQVLIISDPGADQSAAAVRVGVGSWNDPVEYAGMAHFCEHMLFMGTQKYPEENEFFTYVANYAGSTNAFTAPNRTVYMFSSQAEGFLMLLDRFAHFFIDPLFNPSGIAREMHAVDQESAKNIENDSWREYMVFKETANPLHPNHLFSTGNSQTLAKIPQSALQQWHANHYGAEKMHLVIYSSLPVEEIKASVVEIFNAVPKALMPPQNLKGPITSAQQLGHITYIKPIQDRQTLTFSWELPESFSVDASKSADLVAYAIRRGQKYSLYEYPKNQQFIDSMNTQVDEIGGTEHRFFQISLELTQKGLEQMDTVALRVFETIASIQKQGLPAYLFLEKNAMAQLNYQYQERQDPFEYITKLADSVADESLSSYPRNTLLASEFDSNKIKQMARLLKPQSCMISLLAKPELVKVSLDKREKWYGAEYAIRPIPEKWLSSWKRAAPNTSIRIAEQNPFLPKNLEIAATGPSVPELIADHEAGRAYYVRSAEFAIPESVYKVRILSPQLTPTTKSSVLASLYLDHITDVLHPMLTAASQAGLSARMDLSGCALVLNISGYSDKAELLLQEILKQMPLNPPTAEQFAIYVARHEKGYSNGQKELPFRQAKELVDSIINPEKATKQSKLAALKEIGYEEFLDFHEKLFEKTYAQALFAGNLTFKDAQKAWIDIVHFLGKAPFPKEEQITTKILQLPEGGGPYLITESTRAMGNATFLLIDEGNFSFEKRAAQEVLSLVTHELFFNELRTKQKTGYIAQSRGIELEERLFQFFVVQSNSHGTEDLLFRFEQFIEELSDQLSEKIDEERFSTLKLSLVDSLKTRFRSLRDKAALWENLAFDRNGQFDFVEKRIEGLQNLSYKEFLHISQNFLGRKNRKRLAVLYDGKIPSPFSYESVQVAQLQKIATYVSKEDTLSKEDVMQEAGTYQ